jgi:hypothetical protein
MKNKLILLALIAISNIYSCQNTAVVHQYVYKNLPQDVVFSNKQLSYIFSLSVSCAQDNKQLIKSERYELPDFLFLKN